MLNLSLDQYDELQRRLAILEALVELVGHVSEDEYTGIAIQTAFWDVQKALKPEPQAMQKAA